MSAAQASISAAPKSPKKGAPRPHICPPSQAAHPCDRWETCFVYAFITKFTNLRSKVEGLEGSSDLEDAIMSPIQHPVLVQILARFVVNLKPQAKSLSPDQLSATIASILHEHIKSPTERTVFWDEQQGKNVDPLANIAGGFWGCDWDLKLRILRMLVELQLTHCQNIRDTINKAWNVGINTHKKKEKDTLVQADSSGPSQQNLATAPIATDVARLRYWHFDDSPRLYVSGNPWKIACDFKCKTKTRQEFMQIIEELKEREKSFSSKKQTKAEEQHILLRQTLESKVEAIDKELLRVQKVRKKIEQREILKAQAELRSTRTRRSTRRPDYVYSGQDFGDDDDDEEYKDQGEDGYDEEDYALDDEDGMGRRRSNRVSEKNSNGKRGADAVGDWKGERRSTRLGANTDVSDYGPAKRQRTEERSTSSAPSDTLESPVLESNTSASANGSTKKVKDGEIAVEQVAGKKKSKYWFYAVEPSSGVASSAGATSSADPPESPVVTNGSSNIKTEDDGLKTQEAPVTVNGINGHAADATSLDHSHDETDNAPNANGFLSHAQPMKKEIQV